MTKGGSGTGLEPTKTVIEDKEKGEILSASSAEGDEVEEWRRGSKGGLLVRNNRSEYKLVIYITN